MKTFNHVGAAKELKPLSATQVKGRRFYKTPEDNWYPSVTTIVSHISSATLKAWEERVGFEEAEKVRRTSALRGTKYHGIVEAYLKGDTKTVDKSEGLPAYLFRFSREVLDNIDNVHAIEAPLYSDDLRIAGRVDCIAEYCGELAIIDFKTTKELKREEWLHKYFVQEAAYAYMYWERTGCEVKKLVTISVAEDGQIQVVEKYDKTPYIDVLCEWIKEFRYYLEGIKS